MRCTIVGAPVSADEAPGGQTWILWSVHVEEMWEQYLWWATVAVVESPLLAAGAPLERIVVVCGDFDSVPAWEEVFDTKAGSPRPRGMER